MKSEEPELSIQKELWLEFCCCSATFNSRVKTEDHADIVFGGVVSHIGCGRVSRRLDASTVPGPSGRDTVYAPFTVAASALP